MSDTTCQIEDTTKGNTKSSELNSILVETEEVTETETFDSAERASSVHMKYISSSTQTELFINKRPTKNKTTQTCQNPNTNTSSKVKMMSTATQTYLTNEYLLKKLVTDAVPKTQISSTTQTDQIEYKQTAIDDTDAHHALLNPTATESTELLDTDSELSYQSSEDDYVEEIEVDESNSGSSSNEQLILSDDKSPQD